MAIRTLQGLAEQLSAAGVATSVAVCSCARSTLLEDGGGTELFGEPRFEITDLLRTAPDGRGIISCLELPGVQDKPFGLLKKKI